MSVSAAEPDILVVRDGWQEDRDTVRKVFESTAREFSKYFPEQKIEPIIVYPKGGPIVFFQRGPGNEYVVHLDTGRTYWAQYAYQFSHELCHIYCRYDEDGHGNDWFEESICEMASLFVLRRMSETWKTDPPFDHWKDFAPRLADYAEQRLQDSRLKEGQTLAGWYRMHQAELHGSSKKRALNQVVAGELLPLFEASPESWQAVWYLNEAQPNQPQRFEDYLADWHQHAPEKHRAFIEKIAGQLGVEIR